MSGENAALKGEANRQAAKPRAKGAGFTGPQKAALIIAALGPEAAKPIIDRIGEKHLRSFADAYAHLEGIPRTELMAVVSEFLGHLGSTDELIQGGFEETQSLLTHFKGADDATKLLDDVPGGRSVWEKLERADDKAFAAYLELQHPQTVAVVLSRLDGEKAATLLALLSPGFGKKTLARLAKPAPVRREALRVLEDSIEREFLAPSRRASKVESPGGMIGAMLNNLSEEKRAEMLEFIAAETPEILEDVKAQILTFKDIPARVPANAIAKVIREVDVVLFLKAAKYGRQNAPETIEFMFKNISQRMVQQYEEQMAELKQVTLTEAEAAQAQIMIAVRRLVAAGEFKLNKIESEPAVDTEVYV